MTSSKTSGRFDVFTNHKGRYAYAGSFDSPAEIAARFTSGGRQGERVALAAEAAAKYGEPYSAHGIGGRSLEIIVSRVAPNCPEMGETVEFRGNEPDGTPASFSGVVLEASTDGSMVGVSIYGYSDLCWLPASAVQVAG